MIKKSIKLRKITKNNKKNQTIKKTIKPIRILKNQPVQFYKPGTEKTKLNSNRKKPEPN
jgi:hypothetical protein